MHAMDGLVNRLQPFQGLSGVELKFAFALWAPKTDSVKQKPFVLADVYTSVDAVD
jgi:hypothetical protein